MKCLFCHTELEPCRLPFCCIEHVAWYFLDKPPLATDPMEEYYDQPMQSVRTKDKTFNLVPKESE